MKNTFCIYIILLLLNFPLLVQAKSLNIVTSIPPLNALTAGIVDGVSETTMLIPPEASHHHFTFKPSAMRSLQNADVVIWVGNSLEIFLQKPIANLSSKTSIITIEKIPGLTLYPTRTSDGSHGHVHNSNIDPHVWLDAQNSIVIINSLTQTFAKIDPENAKQYQNNAESMIKQIQTLDAQLKKELKPVKEKPFLVFHDGYQYFEKHYQLNYKGSVAIDADLPPSAKRLHQLQEQIRAEKIVCVFTEPHLQSTIINTLVRDTQVHVATLDTMGRGLTFSDYLDLLRKNGNELKKCLL